ncbi:MAG: molybdopterin cofactor-binding domain-containing protein, partial [candidate division NC10 bacterium]
MRGSTADDYATRLRVRILPLLGSLPLTEITRERVRRFLGELAARGNRRVTKHRPLARATLKGTLHVLSALLGRAAEDGLIPVNPARGLARDIAAPTSSEVQEVEVFTPGELGGLLGIAESDYPEWHPFLLCLARTGIRLGEAVALEWRDVDFERRVLVIRRTERRGRVNVPKSGKARRVDMSPQLTATLSGLTSLQEAEAALVGRTAPARVFPMPGPCGPIRDDVFRNNVWPAVLRRAGRRELVDCVLLSKSLAGGMYAMSALVFNASRMPRIAELDVRDALNAPGVVAVLTGEEVAGLARPIRAEHTAPGYKPSGWPVLGKDKVRFVGEPVAAVAATDRYRAEDALERIRASYDPLPAVTDAERSMEAAAPRLHEELPDNILIHLHHDNGKVEQVFAEAEIQFSETFRHSRCSATPMENRGVAAQLDGPSGMLTVWVSHQAPHLFRTGLAETLDLPESRIRVIAPAVGGGFGAKMHLYPEDVAVCLLAMRLGRPVKWFEDRRENLLAGSHAREYVGHIEVAAKRDGTILGFKARLISDIGAYSLYPTSAALEP